MSVNQTWSTSIKSDAGTATSVSAIYSAGAEENFNDVAPASGQLEVDLAVNKDKIIAFYIYSDQDVTLTTNSLTTPGQTPIVMKAKAMLAWNTDYLTANPITTSITKIYFTNDTLAEAKIKGSLLLDVTA